MRIRNLLCMGLVILGICCAAEAQMLPSQTYCSVHRNLRGTWAFSEIGWTVPFSDSQTVASPVTVLGAMSVDSSGKITGSGTTISGMGIPGTQIPEGTVLEFDFVGTVELTPDCTGVLKYSIQIIGTPAPLPGQFIERIVYSPGTDEIASMSVQSPLSKPMWIGSYKRIARLPMSITWPTITN